MGNYYRKVNVRMTGTTFDNYFETNYNNLQQFCCNKNIPEDHLNDVYLKIKKSYIVKSGLTEQQYASYVKKSLWNLKLDEKKSLRYKNTINYQDHDTYEVFLEETLNQIDKDHQDSLKYREELEYFTKMLFKFIETRSFSDMDVFIFKSYFLVPKMTYVKLQEKTNIHLQTIKRTIRMFKSEIRNNFILWLKEQNN